MCSREILLSLNGFPLSISYLERTVRWSCRTAAPTPPEQRPEALPQSPSHYINSANARLPSTSDSNTTISDNVIGSLSFPNLYPGKSAKIISPDCPVYVTVHTQPHTLMYSLWSVGDGQNSSPISSQAVSSTTPLGSISLIQLSPSQSLPGALFQPAPAAAPWPLCWQARFDPAVTP